MHPAVLYKLYKVLSSAGLADENSKVEIIPQTTELKECRKEKGSVQPLTPEEFCVGGMIHTIKMGSIAR